MFLSYSLLLYRQLVAIIKEIVGEIHEGDNESCSRIKNISKWAVSVVAVVYGSAALFGHIAFSASGVQGDVLANFDNGIMAQTTRIGNFIFYLFLSSFSCFISFFCSSYFYFLFVHV